jgi:diguanylate cyclase (GGDEF)-like protein
LDAAELAFAARAAQVAIVCIGQARRFEKLRAERELLNSLTEDLMRLTDSCRAENSVLQQAHQKLCAEYQELQEAARSLESLAERDGLTGLYNHRAFQSRLREEVSRAERSGQPLVLALLDLDDFKGYNDAYGHLEGDKALATCGLIMKECVRRCDFVARYGGEEFAVLFPLTELKTARKVADRLRRKLAGHPFVCRPMTVSVGLASYQEGMSPKQLLAAADKALYEAKNAGRNQVRIARELQAA